MVDWFDGYRVGLRLRGCGVQVLWILVKHRERHYYGSPSQCSSRLPRNTTTASPYIPTYLPTVLRLTGRSICFIRMSIQYFFFLFI